MHRCIFVSDIFGEAAFFVCAFSTQLLDTFSDSQNWDNTTTDLIQLFKELMYRIQHTENILVNVTHYNSTLF